jgi:hypothetical protein
VSNCEIEKKICCSSEFTICKRFKLNQQEGCCMPARSGQSSRSDFTDTLKNTAKLFKVGDPSFEILPHCACVLCGILVLASLGRGGAESPPRSRGGTTG